MIFLEQIISKTLLKVKIQMFTNLLTFSSIATDLSTRAQNKPYSTVATCLDFIQINNLFQINCKHPID